MNCSLKFTTCNFLMHVFFSVTFLNGGKSFDLKEYNNDVLYSILSFMIDTNILNWTT